MLIKLSLLAFLPLIFNAPFVQAGGKILVTNRSGSPFNCLVEQDTRNREWTQKQIDTDAVNKEMGPYDMGNSLYFSVIRKGPEFDKGDPAKKLPYLLAKASVPQNDHQHVHYYWHGAGADKQPYHSCNRTIVPHVGKKDGTCKDIGNTPNVPADDKHLLEDKSDLEGVCGTDVDLEIIIENCSSEDDQSHIGWN